VSRADQQIAAALLPGTRQSPARNLCPAARTGSFFIFVFSHLQHLRTIAATVGMALAVQVGEQVLKRQSNSTSLHFLENFKC
jgi:hypothetical protein